MLDRPLSKNRALTVSIQELCNVIQLFFDDLCVASDERLVNVFSRFCRSRRTLRGGGAYVALPRLLSETGRDLEQSRLFFEHL